MERAFFFFSKLSRRVFFAIIVFFHFTQLRAQNNCLHFDASSDNVSFTYNPLYDFNITDKFTIELWFKTSTALQLLLSTHINSATFTGYELSMVSGKIVFDLSNNFPSNSLRVESQNTFADGLWHHVACVYKGIPSAANVDIYVDGNLQPKFVTHNNLTGSSLSGQPMCLGSRGNVNYFFNGSMDEVRIWTRDLCGAEIIARKNCELTGNENGLLAYYNFNQGVATGTNIGVSTLTNATAYTNLTGTLTTFALTGSVSNWVSSNSNILGNCGSFGSSISITGNTIICPSGSSTLSATGASGYTWFPSSTASSSIVLSPTATAIYTVSYPSGTCTAFAYQTVLVTNTPTVLTSFSPTVPICPGTTATLTASGATTYSWLPGNAAGGTITVTPVSSTIYTVTGTLGNCGSNTKTINLTVLPGPTLSILSSTPNICQGNSATLTVSGAGTYTWVPGNFTSTALVVNPVFTSTYTVQASVGSCTAQSNIVLGVNSSPSLMVSASPSVVCQGLGTILSANGALSYTWLPVNSNLASTAVTPTANTIYTVIAANGPCGASGTLNITVVSNPVVSIATSSSTICKGSSTTLLAGGANNYTWYPGGAISGGITVTPNSTTIYTLTGVTGNCSATANAVITVVNQPTISASVSPSVLCLGSYANLQASGANTYTWLPGNFNSSAVSVNPSSTTLYTLVAGNGPCIVNANLSIAVFQGPTVGVSASPATVCAGSPAQLAANGAMSYTWAGNQPGANVTVTPNASSIYTVAYASSLCEGTNTLALFVNLLPTITATSSQSAICSGESVLLTAYGATSYTWLPGTQNGASLLVMPMSTTNYTVSGTDTNSCENKEVILQVVKDCLGIVQSGFGDAGLKIYPNPASSAFTVELAELGGRTECILQNNLGQVVRAYPLKAGINTIEVPDLPDGIYFCTVFCNNQGIAISKVVVE